MDIGDAFAIDRNHRADLHFATKKILIKLRNGLHGFDL